MNSITRMTSGRVATYSALALVVAVAGRPAPARQAAPADAVKTALGHLELGQYPEAQAILDSLEGPSRTAEALQAMAGLSWVKGDVPRAEALHREALASRRARSEAALEVAPFHAGLGRFLLDTGRLDEAEAEFKAAQKLLDTEHARMHQRDIPHDHADYFNLDAAVGLARIYAAKGDANKATRAWKIVAANHPGPEALGAVGDHYASIGKSGEAESMWKRAEKASPTEPKVRRGLARYLLDHGKRLDEAQAIARDESARRKDVETWDLLAWALYRNGAYPEAARAIDEALGPGTKDARIRYHAGMIHAKLGEASKAREELELALKMNPHFCPSGVDEARRTLEGLVGANSAGSGR